MWADWTDEQYAEYQGPNDSLPEVEGPFISDLKPISELIKDYEEADTFYASKTRNLAQSFHSWRRSKPDGGCGWRAIPFVLFELLLQQSSKDQIEQFHATLLSFNQSLEPVMDNSPDLVDEFTSPTFELLQQMVDWLPLTNRRELLVDAFNNNGIEGTIAYHFKLLASVELITHADNYAPFLDGESIEERVQRMKTVSYELEDISNQALYNLVLEPAGFGLEVLVLHRNPGDHVDQHSRVPDKLAGSDTVIRLLYRPGHYDIIYKSPSVVPTQIQVGAVHVSVPHVPTFTNNTSASFYPSSSLLEHWTYRADMTESAKSAKANAHSCPGDSSEPTIRYPTCDCLDAYASCDPNFNMMAQVPSLKSLNAYVTPPAQYPTPPAQSWYPALTYRWAPGNTTPPLAWLPSTPESARTATPVNDFALPEPAPTATPINNLSFFPLSPLYNPRAWSYHPQTWSTHSRRSPIPPHETGSSKWASSWLNDTSSFTPIEYNPKSNTRTKSNSNPSSTTQRGTKRLRSTPSSFSTPSSSSTTYSPASSSSTKTTPKRKVPLKKPTTRVRTKEMKPRKQEQEIYETLAFKLEEYSDEDAEDIARGLKRRTQGRRRE